MRRSEPRLRRRLRGLLALALLPAVGLAAVPWTALDPALREVLAPWRSSWNALPEPARAQLADNARRWAAMTPAERAAYRTRAEAFAELPPGERAQLRGRYADWEALEPAERQRLLDTERAYLALPEARREALQAAFEALDPDARTAWRLGPEVGQWFSGLRPLFAFVPVEERDATLEMLRALPPETRETFSGLARRLSASQREALRRDLLAAEPDARAALVRSRAGGQ
ncbi:DUF3106 domain-containing protein [Coralloluteibacterium thermophilus]|uniref:DUF3106 domain-containing protein n=1 Tax=Coralloluteibacterium thermophilum TaxID=2707049 RepID=A0ABV9NFU8_9GAMM